MDLTFDRLHEALLNSFPMLSREAEAIYAADLPYVIIESVFTRYLTTVVHHGAERERVADFVNRMAESTDEGVREVLKTEVVPTLLRTQEILDSYWPHLRHEARRFLWLETPLVAPEIVLAPCSPCRRA